MCRAKQFAMTHVVIFVLCACNAVDRLVCALRAFLYPLGDAPHKARMTFCTAVCSEEKLFSLFCFGLAPPGVINKKSRKARLQ